MKVKVYSILYILALVTIFVTIELALVKPQNPIKVVPAIITPTPTIPMGTGYYRTVNEYRVAHGKRPMVKSLAIENSANARAYRIANGLDTWSHDAFRAGAKKRIAANVGMGENLARIYGNFDDVMLAWDNSPTHKAVMLGDWCEMGIGNDGIYWVLHVRRDFNAGKDCYK